MNHLKQFIVTLGATLIWVTTAHVSMGKPPPVTRSTMRVVEIRTFNLKPGTRSEFHRLASEVAAPMQRRWKIDVVACGPSAHDDNSYDVIRAWPTLAERQRTEEGFYGSDEWRKGPQGEIMARIESYTTVVLYLDAATVEGLRRSSSGRSFERTALGSPGLTTEWSRGEGVNDVQR
jgi:hypothetical protein